MDRIVGMVPAEIMYAQVETDNPLSGTKTTEILYYIVLPGRGPGEINLMRIDGLRTIVPDAAEQQMIQEYFARMNARSQLQMAREIPTAAPPPPGLIVAP